MFCLFTKIFSIATKGEWKNILNKIKTAIKKWYKVRLVNSQSDKHMDALNVWEYKKLWVMCI